MWWHQIHWQCPCLMLSPLWVTPLPLYQSSRVLGSLFEWGEYPGERKGTSFEVTGRERDWHLPNQNRGCHQGVHNWHQTFQGDNQSWHHFWRGADASDCQSHSSHSYCGQSSIWPKPSWLWSNSRFAIRNSDHLTWASLTQQWWHHQTYNKWVSENAGPPPAQEQQWLWTVPTICHRKNAGMSNLKGRWANHPWSQVINYDELVLFLMTFPLTYIKNTLHSTMNKSLPSKDKMFLRKYIQWPGITFFMACFEEVLNRKQWFSKEPPKRDSSAPFHCNDWMSSKQYEQIMQAHWFTYHDPPEFEDKFFKICQLPEAWNE